MRGKKRREPAPCDDTESNESFVVKEDIEDDDTAEANIVVDWFSNPTDKKRPKPDEPVVTITKKTKKNEPSDVDVKLVIEKKKRKKTAVKVEPITEPKKPGGLLKYFSVKEKPPARPPSPVSPNSAPTIITVEVLVHDEPISPPVKLEQTVNRSRKSNVSVECENEIEVLDVEDENRRRSSRLASRSSSKSEVKKLAPLFAPKRKNPPSETPEMKAAIEARKTFLTSGLPEEVAKRAARLAEKGEQEEPCLPTAENIHVGLPTNLPFDIHHLAEEMSKKLLKPTQNEEITPKWTTTPLPNPSRLIRPQVKELDFEEVWTETVNNFIGNEEAVKKAEVWLKDWKVEKVKKKRRKDYSDSEDSEEESHPSILLISGPPGVGKTSLVHHLAAKQNLIIIEVNCSAKRSGKIVLNQLKEAIKCHQLHQGCVILLDDVDVVFEGEDDGFLSAVGGFAVDTRRPIVLTTTCRRGFEGNFDTVLVELEPVKTSTLSSHLIEIAKEKGKFHLEQADAVDLAEYCRGDVRRALNELQAVYPAGKEVLQGLLGLENFSLEEEQEVPVLGLFHRNLVNFLGVQGGEVEKKQPVTDFWAVLEAEVSQELENPQDLKLDNSIFSASDDEEEKVGEEVHEEPKVFEEKTPKKVSESCKKKMEALAVYFDSVASQDSFCGVLGLSGNEWPTWHGVTFEHGLGEEWSSFGEETSGISSSIAGFVEKGEMKKVCSILSQSGEEGREDLFNLLAFSRNLKGKFQVWDESVEMRRKEMDINSSNADCLDRIPLHRALNRSSFTADFMPGFRQLLRNDVRSGKLKNTRRQRRGNLRANNLTLPHLCRTNYLFDDLFVKKKATEKGSPPLFSMRICVIGAGAAGLSTLKNILNHNHSVVCYERDVQVGGTWIFNNRKGTDEHGLPIHSSMYKFLRTNLPKEVMAFPGFPFPESLESFVGHEQVLDYLVSYAKHYDLERHIKFQHYVESVTPKPPSGWKITTRNLQTDTKLHEEFDAVFVCNGHYFDPYDPHIPGYEAFKGLKMHCHNFRDADELKKVKKLALVGAGPSGWDLAAELATRVEHIYLLARSSPRMKCPNLPPNIERKQEPVACTENSLMLASGETITVDAIMLCTGYLYSFPFLTKQCGITVSNHQVSPLYKHCVNIEHPTMFFIGVVSTVIPFILFDYQVKFCLEGHLPDRKTMLEDADRELAKRLAMGWPAHYYHKMAELQFEYMNDLAELSGAQKVPAVVEKLYNHVAKWRGFDLFSYKKRRFRIVNDHEFVDVTGDGKEGDPTGALK